MNALARVLVRLAPFVSAVDFSVVACAHSMTRENQIKRVHEEADRVRVVRNAEENSAAGWGCHDKANGRQSMQCFRAGLTLNRAQIVAFVVVIAGAGAAGRTEVRHRLDRGPF